MDLETRKEYLPSKLEELSKFVLIGRDKLISVRAEIRAIDKLELATEVREQKKEEAQWLAGALLDAEAKIGEMFKEIPTKQGLRTSGGTKLSKVEKTKELGFDKHQVYRFETLADNKDIIEEVKAEARENEDLPTRTEVLRRVKEKAREEYIDSLRNTPVKLPEGEFNVIYADPPWKYENSGFEMSAENQYPVMSVQEMLEKIKFDTSENSVLFLWVTNPLLFEVKELIKGWGFEYKTNFVWVKKRHTAGFYVYGKHELLLICTKGSMLPIGEKYKSIIEGDNIVHSKKPEVVYEMIESMYPNQKYLELFARTTRNGWTSYGNDI